MMRSTSPKISPSLRRALDFAYGKRAPESVPNGKGVRPPRANLILDAMEDLAEVLLLATRALRAQRDQASHEGVVLSGLPRAPGIRRFSTSSPGTQPDGGPGNPDGGPAGSGDGGPSAGDGGPSAGDGGPGTGDGGPGTGDGGPGTGGGATGTPDGGPGTGDGGPSGGGSGSAGGGPGTGGTGTGGIDGGSGTADAGAPDAGTVSAIQGAAQELVGRHEGSRASAYTDTAGHPTVGIGFNLDRPDARATMTNLGIDYDAVRGGTAQLTSEQIGQLFDQTLGQAVASSERLVSNFNSLPQNVQLVVVDMVFNLGEAGFSRFQQTIGAIQEGDFQRAAAEMQNSTWYQQTGTRAQEDVRLMQYQANDGGTP